MSHSYRAGDKVFIETPSKAEFESWRKEIRFGSEMTYAVYLSERKQIWDKFHTVADPTVDPNMSYLNWNSVVQISGILFPERWIRSNESIFEE